MMINLTHYITFSCYFRGRVEWLGIVLIYLFYFSDLCLPFFLDLFIFLEIKSICSTKLDTFTTQHISLRLKNRLSMYISFK